MRSIAMRNPWYHYTDSGKFSFFGGAIIIGALIYDYIFGNLPKDFDALSSDLLYGAFGFGLIYYGFKQKIPKNDFSVGQKYEVIKISQFGTQTYGPYNTRAEAEVAVEKFEDNLFDESFYEIKVASAEKYNDKH